MRFAAAGAPGRRLRRRRLAGVRDARRSARGARARRRSLAERIARARLAARDGALVWLVLPDPFPTRVFVDCGIVECWPNGCRRRLHVVLALPAGEALEWVPRLGDVHVGWSVPICSPSGSASSSGSRGLDLALDRNVGYYPLSVRHSLRHGFNRERMRPGHPKSFLDSSRTGRLPESESLERLVRRWLFSPHRYTSRMLVARMRDECSGLVVANVQSLQAVPYLNAARRLGLPVVGYVASWDHTVGKGIVSPHVDRYVVQNEVMRDDLVALPRRSLPTRSS